MNVDFKTYDLNWEVGEKEQVLQNLKNLIRVGMFNIPLNRQIGVSKDYIDKSEDEAKILLLSEIERNLEIYEPRIKLKNFDLIRNEFCEYELILDLIEVT